MAHNDISLADFDTKKHELEQLTAKVHLEGLQATVARGTFGSPTFFVDDEIFFGKDRLRDVEDEIARMKA